jgi:hypothetical protein
VAVASDFCPQRTFIHLRLTVPAPDMASLPQPVNYDATSKLKEMDSVPLFMKSLPDDHDQLNAVVEALQALVHEGTPEGRFITHGEIYF